MTSSINYTNIDATFPVAGQDNSSQGFRDNFQNIKTNFQYAYNEISALQANAVLAGQANDLQGNILGNAAVKGLREILYDHGTVSSGSLTYNFYNGNYQLVNLGASLTVAFTNFSTITDAMTIRLGVVVPNANYTVTWPSSVSQNISTLDKQSGQITRFSNTGFYIFQLTTADGGTTWSINELTRNHNEFQGNVNFYTLISNTATTGVSITVGNNAGTVVGNVYADNFVGAFVSSGNSATFSGNVTADNLIANTAIYGILGNTAGLQPNITLVGNLTSLSVTGNANVGNATVTGLSDMCGGTAYGLQTETITDGGSTQLWSNIGAVLLRTGAGVGTISTHTIIMPATPYNGQAIQIMFANTVTTLTQSGSGSQTVNGAFATANTTFGGTWTYVLSTDAWYRVG